ncbi:hypothetical protein QA634_23240 [Methylobacterium sp. CB376]|nr:MULTISPECIES: hypothetical protein [Methylobacterium]WFT78188.1 hypothetical protein QA634_23240 [Methylobacterium nodulans]
MIRDPVLSKRIPDHEPARRLSEAHIRMAKQSVGFGITIDNQ